MSRKRSRALAIPLTLLSISLGLPSCTSTELAGHAASNSAKCRDPETPNDPPDSLDEVRSLIERVIGCGPASQLRLRLQVDPPRPFGWFRLGGVDGAIEVVGADQSSVLAGVNWYLDHVAGVSVTWSGSRVDMADRLTAPATPIERTSVVPHRLALNDTSSAYTNPYRTWNDWERLIDVLALHGVNEVVVTEGQESTYLETFEELGYTRDDLRSWIPLPAHQPWWLLQNLCCSSAPISDALLTRRAALGVRITDRLRALGITPVLPGYAGMVPPDFSKRDATARVVPQGDWNGFRRPDWLDPTSAPFPRVAEIYYRHQRALFGATGMVRMELLHEGGSLGGLGIGVAARAVQEALHRALPGAVWATLGWQENPDPRMLRDVDSSTMLILDGLADTVYEVDRDGDWGSTPFAFGTIFGFGGRTTLGANLPSWVRRFGETASASGTALRGTALLPEAAAGNPLAFDLFTELAWNGGRIDLHRWIDEWAANRYGGGPGGDPHAVTAWRHLAESVYSGPHAGRSQGADSLFGVRPALYIGEDASFTQPLHYDAGLVRAALDELLAVDPQRRNNDAYRFDLADVTRQVLDDHAREILPRIASAVRRRDPSALRVQRARWISTLRLLAEAVGTQEEFLFGRWLADARSWTSDPVELATLRADARLLVSTWGERATADGGLSDYAGREWGGIVDGLYLPRWTLFLDDLESAMDAGRFAGPRDWYANDFAWVAGDVELSAEPSGDVVDVARRARVAVRPAG